MSHSPFGWEAPNEAPEFIWLQASGFWQPVVPGHRPNGPTGGVAFGDIPSELLSYGEGAGDRDALEVPGAGRMLHPGDVAPGCAH